MTPYFLSVDPIPGSVAPRVLCVDDNRDVADSEADLLRLAGFDARACYDGPTALAEETAFHPDVYLIDLHMPGMDGDEVAVRLRTVADGPPPVLVAVTAMGDEASGRRIRAAGFDLHLVKPVDPRELLSAVGALWRTWGARSTGPAAPGSQELGDDR